MRYLSIACVQLLCCVLLLGGAASVAAEEEKELVGPWGDPARIVIEGAKQWPADEIRRALVADIQAIVAGHPSAPLAEYPAVLADRVQEGYLNDGFARATVTAKIDNVADKVVLNIDEGPRFMAGEIEVLGAKQIDAAQLVDWLTQRQPGSEAHLKGFRDGVNGAIPGWVDKNGESVPLEAAIWTKGKPACFAKNEPQWREEAIERALEQQGFRQAKFEASVVTNDADHTATLKISIENEGGPTTIGRLEITGSERDKPDDILRYLDLKVGQTITESKCAALYHKLWLSGRYHQQDVSFVTPEETVDGATLKIQVVEYKHASPLSGPLSAEEQVMLRHREWLLAGIERGDALTVRGEMLGMGCELVAVKEQGALVLVHPAVDKNAAGDKTDAQPAALEGSMLLASTPGEILHAYSGGEQILRTPFRRLQIFGTFILEPKKPETGGDQGFSVTTGFHFKSMYEIDRKAPVGLSVQMAPVAMIGLLHRGSPKVTTADGVLTIESDKLNYKVEMATGRLLGLSLQLRDELARFTISLEPRTFADCLAEAARALPPGALDKPNAFDAGRPLSSSLDFLAGSPMVRAGIGVISGRSKPRDELLTDLRIIKKMLAADLLQPIDDYLKETQTKGEDLFWIPSDECRFSFDFNNETPFFTLSTAKAYAVLLLQNSDQVFPRDSWPWILSRGAAMYLLEKTQFTQGDLQKFRESREIGAVGQLSAASLTGIVSNEYASWFAMSGLGKTTLYEFRPDYRPLLDQNTIAGRFFLRAAEMLRDCDDDEAKELGRLLLGDDADLMLYASRFLREHEAEPIEQALPAMLDYLWSQGLGVAVRNRLKEIILRDE